MEATDFDLDVVAEEAALVLRLETIEPKESSVVTVRASLLHWDRVVANLCRLRAANVSPILLLRRGDVSLEEEEAREVFSWLRLWDQFLIHNFLAVCGEWVPAEVLPKLEAEAKMELLWVREYAAALGDPRIHRYPPLPWRRFLRGINDENYAFVSSFLEIAARPGTAENRLALLRQLDEFLAAKKKVKSLAPKRWRNPGEHDV